VFTLRNDWRNVHILGLTFKVWSKSVHIVFEVCEISAHQNVLNISTIGTS